jgi:hypothetical protein
MANDRKRRDSIRHMATHTPKPQRWLVSHSASLAHVQYPLVHCPFGPHWSPDTHVPQVPMTQACPPGHWLFAMHFEHTPAMHVRPDLEPGVNVPRSIQSSKVLQGPQAPERQPSPAAQSPEA